MAQWVRSLDLTTHSSLIPIQRGFAPGFVNYKKGCTRLAAACDKVYQLLAHGRWFSPGTPASSTIKTGRHDIAEILLKLALKTPKIKSKSNILKLEFANILTVAAWQGVKLLNLSWVFLWNWISLDIYVCERFGSQFPFNFKDLY